MAAVASITSRESSRQSLINQRCRMIDHKPDPDHRIDLFV